MPPRPTGALALLRGEPAFRALATARLVSFLGDSLSLVALLLHVAGSTGQALAVAALLLAGEVLPSLVGPLAGAVADRFDRRRLMIVCEVLQGGLLLVIAVALPVLPLPALLALVGLRALAGQVFAPASRAAVPSLVADRDLESANAVVGLGANGAEAVGPLLAAVLLPLLGLPGVLLVDAASFALSALLLLRLPALRPGAADPAVPAGGLLREARDGLAHIRGARAVRIVVLGFCAVVLANGIDDVALVLLATEELAADVSAVALLLGAVGIGLLVGYLLLARGAGRVPTGALLLVGFAVSSTGNLLTGLAWAVPVAFALQAVRGLGIAAMDLAQLTLLQRLVPDRLLGRVLGTSYGAIGVAAGLSYLGGGLLLDATDAPTTFVVAGTIGCAVTAVVATTLPRALRTARPASPGDPGPTAVE